MTQTQKRRLKWRLFALISGAFLMFQYQNCASPSDMAAQTPETNGEVKVITGSGSNPNLFFVTSGVNISDQTTQLLTSGVCGQTSSAIHWELSETADNALVVGQGSGSCSQGSFHFDLTSSLSQLACSQSYTVKATNSDLGSDEMTVTKTCAAAVASK